MSRFAPLDGMRALAALAVAVYHFIKYVPSLDSKLPSFLSSALHHGNVGVEVFFVLSGFAVARSLVHTELGLRALGRFALRRTIRLDLPYAMTLALIVLLALWHPSAWPIRPTPKLVVAHLLYLQGVLGLPNLLGIFWTLCLEIQLYLGFALLCAFAQRVRLLEVGKPLAADHRFNALLSATTLLATAFGLTAHDPAWNAYLIPWWPVFCLGVLTERALRLPAARPWLAATVLVLVVGNGFRPQIGAIAGLATVAILCLCARFQSLSKVLGGALGALGRRSYSFYLLHSLAAGIVFGVLAHRMPQAIGYDALRVALALAIGLASAALMWRLVEAPAQRWSRRIAADRADVAGVAEPPREVAGALLAEVAPTSPAS